jgi:hypothetical protein
MINANTPHHLLDSRMATSLQQRGRQWCCRIPEGPRVTAEALPDKNAVPTVPQRFSLMSRTESAVLQRPRRSLAQSAAAVGCDVSVSLHLSRKPPSPSVKERRRSSGGRPGWISVGD